MGPRILQLRRKYKLNQSALGELCGVTKAAVSQWETGISTPEIKKLIEIRSKLIFSLDWLITGEGELVGGDLGVIPGPKERRQDNRRQHQRRERNILNNPS